MRLKTILLAIAVVAVSFFVSLKAMDWFSPRGAGSRPALADLPPLPPAPRSSVILAQVTIPITAIRDAADRGTPRNFSGKADNPVSQVLQNADIGWTASRGSIGVTGGQDALSLTTALNGKLNVTGSLAAKATGAVGDAIGGLLGGNVAKQIGSINIKAVNASAEIKGNVTVTARPKFAASWRIEPNLSGSVNLSDTSLSMAGAKLNVPAQIKPVLDKNVADQINAADNRIRNDPSFERSARIQWSQACRSIPLTAGNASAPPLWLELRPTRAVAVQPSISATAINMTLGIEAETRITPKQTVPLCPFPDKISIVPPTLPIVSIGIPIDIPFADVDKIVEAQLLGRNFPEDGSSSVNVTVKHVQVAASGDRLLISLLINAKEKTSFFSFGGEATVYIWGRPVLDQAQSDPAARQCRDGGRVGGRLRAAGRGGTRRYAASAKDAGREDHRRPQAVPGRRAENGRIRHLGFAEEPGQGAGRDRHPEPRACRHRLRFQDAAPDRGGLRHHQRHGGGAAGPLRPTNFFRLS